MAELISGRYARALFELALEKNCIDRYFDDVSLVFGCINGDKEFESVLKHPQISGDEKLEILTNAFKDKISDDILGLFSVALRKNREAELLDIMQTFIEKVKEYKGIVTAKIVSAKPLKGAQIQKIKEKLSQTLDKQVDVEYSIDQRLIGGLQIYVCGRLIDNSIKTKLNGLKNQLEGV